MYGILSFYPIGRYIMRTKVMLISVLMLLLACGATAVEDNTRAGLGLHFGTVSGNGYSMRWMGEDLGLQLTIGAMTSGSNNVHFNQFYYPEDDETAATITVSKKGRDRSLIGAVNILIMLDHFRRGRLYLVGGCAFNDYRKRVFSANYTDTSYDFTSYQLVQGSVTEEDVHENRWTAGLGPGIELAVSRHFRLALEVPITYNYNDDIVMYIPQVGFYYFFK